MLGYADFQWKGDKLMVAGRNSGCKIIPDAKWPNMFRVEYPPGTVSDMANLTRAKDAAISIVASHLNKRTENAMQEPATDVLPAGRWVDAPQSQLTTPSSLAA